MKNKIGKRLLSVLLALFIIIGILPVTPAMAASTVPLSSLTAGDTVNFAGYTWIVLNPGTGYLFMQDNYVPPSDTSGYGYVQFDTAETTLNWFVGSSMEALLNDTFYNSLPSADRALIQQHTWDYGSVAYDASVTYGAPQTVEDYVGLISFKDWTNYSKYWYAVSGFLEYTESDVWTLSTVSGDSQKVWSLHYLYGGRIHSKSITEYALVRPALYLDSNIPITGGTSGNGGTVLPFDPDQCTVTASPSQAPADGFDSSTVTVTLKDSSGNPASGMPVQLTPSSGNSRITPPSGGSGGGSAGVAASGTTDSNGNVAFTVTNSTVESVTYTATDTLDNVTVGTTQVQFVSVNAVTLNWTSLNRPYYDATVIVTGTDTHFVSGTTTLRVFNSGGTDVAGTSTLNVTSNTEVDFYLPDNLPADTYTVILTTGSEVAVATLTVNSQAVDPTISAQPKNTSENIGSTATFSVTASAADGGTLSYQWQSLISGGSWTNVGTNAASYTTPALTADDSGTEFRCRVTNTNSTGAKNSVTSSTATLWVSGAGLTLPLKSMTVGDTVNFAGYAWIVLDPGEGHLLMKNLYNWCAYDSSHKSFDVAAIRSLLNSTLYNSLPSADSAQIQKHNWPVFDIALDGTVGDGANVNDSIGLLTYQEWQAYSKHYTASGFLDNPSSRFWTLTKVTDYGYVWYVDTDGALKYMSPSISAYARPALYLDPDIQLSGNGGSGSTVLPFDVSQSTVTASPGKLAADGTASSTVTVTLKDSGGTPLSGVAVTLASSSANSVITPPSGGSGGGSSGASAYGTTDSIGQTTFTVTNAVAEQVTCTATADDYDNDTLGTANIEFAAMKFTSAGSAIFTVGKSGSFTVAVTGSTAPSLTVTGSLPTGVTFTDNGDGTATIAGTSDASGTYPLVITATCTDQSLMLPSISQSFTLKINRVPAEKAALPTQTVTVGTSAVFNASDIAEDEDGDTLTITAITAVPASGTATADLSGGSVTVAGVAPGSTSVEVTVSDGTDTVNISVPITVDSIKPTITTASLGSGKINSAYSAALSATGDIPINWSVESGSLPDGLSLSGNTISGTATSRGTFTFTVKAENSVGSDTKELSIVIIGIAPAITTSPYGLRNGTNGEYYSETLTATGDGPITWTIYSGGLPPGLTLDANTGVICGIPTQANGYGIYVRATNSSGSDTKWLQITTYTEFPVITTNSLSGGTVGSAYSEELSARGNAPITWSVESGSLPDDLSLSGSTISGTPTKAGTFTFTLKASNTYHTDRMTFTIVINVSNATVPVTNISNVPATATVDIPLTLTGTVEPVDATNQTIVWSVQDAGTTCSTVSGNILTTTAVGTVTVRATLTDNTTGNPDYSQEFVIVVKAHPPIVTGVTVNSEDFSVEAGGGTQIFSATVLGTYNPAQTVTWSVSGNNSKYTTINSSGQLYVDWYETATALTVTATSTVDNTRFGTAAVTVIPAVLDFEQVWDIYDVPTTATAGTPLTLTGTVDPYYATNQTIVWSVQNAGTTGATVSGNILSTTGSGVVVVRATITNGLTESSDYTQDFNITVNPAPVTDAAISIGTGSFDKYTPADVQTTVTWGSATGVTDVKAGGISIGADNYSVSGNTLTIKKGYLAVQATGSLPLTVEFNAGAAATLTITVTDTTPPIISPASRNYDLSAPADVTSAITWNSAASVTDVVYGMSPDTTVYTLGMEDYTISGDALTIKNSFFSRISLTSGVTLEFDITFNTGATATMAVNVVNKYTPSGDADLNSLSVNGTAVSGFDPDDPEYDVELPYGASSATVTATASDSNAHVSITQASNLPGSATVTVTAEDGSTTRTYMIRLTIASPVFVPVTGIAGVPAAATSGMPLTLTGTVAPDSATNKTIVWSVKAAGDTGATVTGNILSTTAAGAVIVTATITNGLTVSTDFTQDFTISVSATPVTTYTVTFNSNGAVYTTKTVNAGLSIGSAAWPADPSRNSYTFGGWFTGENGAGAQFTSATPVNATMTVYAKWTYSGGGGGGYSSGGEGTSSSTPTYTAEVSIGNGSNSTLPVTVDKNGGSASVDVGSGNNLMSKGKTTVITVPAVPDVDTYTLDIPAPSLSTQDEQGTLAFKTDMGTVTVPSDMLTGVSGISGSKAGISIGQGDKTSLPSDVKAAIGDKPLISLSLSIDGKQTDWNNPDVPVTVSIPYIPTAAELANLESIVVWFIDGSGNTVSVPNGHYDPVAGTVTFTTTHFSNYAVLYNKVSFTDASDTAWYGDAVGFIAARGITEGTDTGKFSPDAKLTRGDFIVMLMRAYSIAPDESPADNFSDAGDTYYTGYLAAAKRLGISRGIGDNLYAPGKEITRQEMFTLLYNALKVIGRLPEGTEGKALSAFSDVGDIASWAKDAMTLLVETGTIGGNAGKLNPVNTTTRAEMAQVLYNLLAK